MSEPIRIYVGSDVDQYRTGAERVLEHSIRKHTEHDVRIVWMRAGERSDPDVVPGFSVSKDGSEATWNVRRQPGQAWPKHGFGTDFSVFRMAVPELAGFTGKAIYLDVDMVVLGDVAELWNMSQKAPYLCTSRNRTEVALIECAAFQVPWWPRLAVMKPSGVYLHEYRNLLLKHGFIDPSLPEEWNHCDVVTPTSKLVHYTAVPWQPWRPYRSVKYQEHPSKAAAQLWFQTLEEARA